MSYWNSRYEDQWPAYVSVAERRANAAKEVAKLRKKGIAVSPVTIEGKKIATTFWGKAWCDNLESYHDFEYRLERGRSYVRNGAVVDLQVAPREVTARVSGSSVYKVKVTIQEVPSAQWRSICADCSGGIDSLVELLQGRFSKGVMERICRQGSGLFPKPAEIKFSCSCLDGASMCKHVSAVMYGIGARLDAMPELLFRLRAVNENDLVADIGDALPMTKRGPGAGKVLEVEDMAALFGLDMGGEEGSGDIAPAALTAAPAARREKVPGARKPAVGASKSDAWVAGVPDKAASAAGSRREKGPGKPAVWEKSDHHAGGAPDEAASAASPRRERGSGILGSSTGEKPDSGATRTPREGASLRHIRGQGTRKPAEREISDAGAAGAADEPALAPSSRREKAPVARKIAVAAKSDVRVSGAPDKPGLKSAARLASGARPEVPSFRPGALSFVLAGAARPKGRARGRSLT